MFGIKTRHNLLRAGIFSGKTDIHSHLLPGVDDGSPDVEHSLSLLDFMEHEVGYARMWFTPHVMSDLKNTAAKLQTRFEEFLPHYKGGMELHLASEYMMDADFQTRLNTDPLPLGREHLLVETSYMSGPLNLDDILLDVWNHGFRPLIAHPERYMYMQRADYEALKAKGYEFQLNLMSLSGYYGARPKLVAENLMEWGFYDYVGSDLHHLERYAHMLRDMKLTKKQIETIEELLANNENV